MSAIINKDQDVTKCAEECLYCFKVCTETLYQYCLQEGDQHTEAKHIKLMEDCLNICRTSAEFMLRGSANHKLICRACAEICQQCAEDCARFDDQPMKACAEACMRCAEMCRQMSS